MTLPEKIKKYGLESKDWFQHKHYTIITRMGIDKIQAYEKIKIYFEAVTSTPEFCVVKATGTKDTLSVQTYGSAKYGGKEWVAAVDGKKGYWLEHGNTNTWYVMEMAEKRAMSRAVLKITGFYELGVFGEDESEDFKKEQIDPTTLKQEVKRKEALSMDQFHNLLLPENHKHVPLALKNYRMGADQRQELEKINA